MTNPLDNLTSGEQLRRLLLQEEQERLDRLEVRLGDDDALKASLVPLIADVLRDAGVQDYRRLAAALAPVVLQSIKTEIHNSRDMMVDALYPITGRLVAAAVRNAFRDLVEQLNQKLDSSLSVDRWRARLKARMTGRSEAEILLSEGAAFEITDLLLIDRETGLLIAQAGADAEEGGMDSHLLGSILTAIMAFVRDAMHESPEQDLRTLHVGDMRLHLQASPGAVLAIKTKGPPPAGFDSALNEIFCAFLARWGEAMSDPDDLDQGTAVALREDLERRFQALLQAKQKNFRAPSRKGTILLGGLALIMIGLIGWQLFGRWERGTIEARARTVIADMPGLTGYPFTVRYMSEDGIVSITGLTPNDEVLERLRQALAKALPETELAFDVQALPKPNVDLDHLVSRDEFARSNRALEAGVRTSFDQDTRALQAAVETIESALLTDDEREVAAFRAWLDRQSLRFGEGNRFDDEVRASAVLSGVVERFWNLPADMGLLIVGYADEIGAQQASAKVSLARAEIVSKRLKILGLPPERLAVVGRGDENRISQETGLESANRRVEFEVRFLQKDRVFNKPNGTNSQPSGEDNAEH